MKVEIVTKDGHCPYCVKAKEMLHIRNITYEEKILGKDISRENLLERAPGAKTVPQIWINEEYVGGSDKLEQWFNDNEGN